MRYWWGYSALWGSSDGEGGCDVDEGEVETGEGRFGQDGRGEERRGCEMMVYIESVEWDDCMNSGRVVAGSLEPADFSISSYLRRVRELLSVGFKIRFGGVCCLFRDIEMLFSGSVRVPSVLAVAWLL